MTLQTVLVYLGAVPMVITDEVGDEGGGGGGGDGGGEGNNATEYLNWINILKSAGKNLGTLH